MSVNNSDIEILQEDNDMIIYKERIKPHLLTADINKPGRVGFFQTGQYGFTDYYGQDYVTPNECIVEMHHLKLKKYFNE